MAKKEKITPFPSWLSRSPNGNEKGYIRLPPSLWHSDAMCDITPLMLRMYIDMLYVAGGHREFIYSRRTAQKNISISADGFRVCVEGLCAVGLIERLPRGCYAAGRYRLSTRWRNYSCERDALTNEKIKKKWN